LEIENSANVTKTVHQGVPSTSKQLDAEAASHPTNNKSRGIDNVPVSGELTFAERFSNIRQSAKY
jgi:hypothetical protein